MIANRALVPRGRFLGYIDVETQKPSLDGISCVTGTQRSYARQLDNPLAPTSFQPPVHTEDLPAEEVSALFRAEEPARAPSPE